MFRKLLVPLDHSALAEQALGPAATLARESGATIDLALVHAPWPTDGFEDAPWNVQLVELEEKYLDTIAKELKSGAGVEVSHSCLRGEPITMLTDHARHAAVDLIVMTSHGRTGLSRAWIGSVADGVMRHAAVPVLMLHPQEHPQTRRAGSKPFRHVLVPLDGSPLSLEILPAALSLAKCSAAEVTLLEVVRPVPLVTPDLGFTAMGYGPALFDDRLTEQLVDISKKRVDTLASRLRAEHNLRINPEVIIAPSVAAGIIETAATANADVIAMSTHGRGASRFVLGSVADKIVRSSGVPVMLRRPTSVAHRPLLNDEEVERQLPAIAGQQG